MTPRVEPLTDPYRATIEDRICELWRYRQWWRQNRWADWPDVRRDAEFELRALVAVARKARRLEAARPDPIDQYRAAAERGLSYHDVQARP